MSILANTYPVQADLPLVQALFSSDIGATQLLFALGVVMALISVFGPVISSFFKAIHTAAQPHLSLEERKRYRTLKSVWALNNMANDLDHSQPNQAAELRLLASRA